ncbi:MAG TPA: NUDIX hydrolase [Jiangellaceae bacterium]|nr:NUDIX hydrolase [Jiangellaceae bacterium]
MALLHRNDGDGWLECACGRRHWGRHGAAGLMLIRPDDHVLLQHRAVWSHEGGTWALPGGARSSTESALATALREATEEAAVNPASVNPSNSWVDDHGSWSYTTVVAHTRGEVEVGAADPESVELRWVHLDEVAGHALHPAFAAAWPRFREHATCRLVLVVDAANVVGSRPDGWWRDRVGANTRLRDRLAELAARGIPASELGLPGDVWWPDISLVVEGQARGIESIPEVTVHSAQGDGDELIADTVATSRRERPQDHVVAVTADRALRSRIGDLDAAVVGPGTLLGVL